MNLPIRNLDLIQGGNVSEQGQEEKDENQNESKKATKQLKRLPSFMQPLKKQTDKKVARNMFKFKSTPAS